MATITPVLPILFHHSSEIKQGDILSDRDIPYDLIILYKALLIMCSRRIVIEFWGMRPGCYNKSNVMRFGNSNHISQVALKKHRWICLKQIYKVA